MILASATSRVLTGCQFYWNLAKGVVFSIRDDVIEYVKQYLEERGLNYATMTVGMSTREQSRMVNKFDYDPKTILFLLSPRYAILFGVLQTS